MTINELRAIQGERGWGDDTVIRILCDECDDQDLRLAISRHIDFEDESSMEEEE